MSEAADCSHTELIVSASRTHNYSCKSCGAQVGAIAKNESIPGGPESEHQDGNETAVRNSNKKIWIGVAAAVALVLVALSATGVGVGGGTSVGGVSANSNAGDFITPTNHTMMRINGLDAYDSTGKSITLAEFASNYLALLDRRLGTHATSDQVSIGLESGNSLYGALHHFFSDENAISVVGIEMQKDAVH